LPPDEENRVTHDVRGAVEEPATSMSTRSVARTTLIVVSVLFGVMGSLWVLYRLAGVLLLLVLAVFFAYLVAPLVARCQRPIRIGGRTFVLPRSVAIVVVYVLFCGSLAAALVLLLPRVDEQLGELAREAPGYLDRVQSRWQTWQASYRSHAFPRALVQAIDRGIQQTAAAAGTYATNEFAPRVAGWLVYLPWLVLVPILAFFLLRDAERLRASALRMLPSGHLRSRADVFLMDLNDTLSAYTRAQVTASLLIGIACTIGFFAIGVPYAAVLGIAAGLLEFIPIAGPLTIGLVATGFAAFHSTGQVLAVAIFLVGLRIVEDYVVYPRLVGKGMHLHPLGVILAIICGAEFGGLAGVFLAVPAVAVLALASSHYRDHRAAAARPDPP
jgi:predicted PurR-regulated permease PerM